MPTTLRRRYHDGKTGAGPNARPSSQWQAIDGLIDGMTAPEATGIAYYRQNETSSGGRTDIAANTAAETQLESRPHSGIPILRLKFLSK
jgi:hypothetical protein